MSTTMLYEFVLHCRVCRHSLLAIENELKSELFKAYCHAWWSMERASMQTDIAQENKASTRAECLTGAMSGCLFLHGLVTVEV